MNRNLAIGIVLLIACLGVWWIFSLEAEADVVLYCGVDQDQSIPIVQVFEKETGLATRYEGEIESQRSIGLPEKLLAERERPRADVYWSNEIMAMENLSDRGLLAPLPAGIAQAFPEAWRDPDGHYVAFGARARILLVNTELLPDPETWPDAVEDLLDPRYAEMGLQTSMARPLTGTTYTHAVALLTEDEAGGRAFLEAVAKAADEGHLRLAESNGSAMRLVKDASNKVAFCLTDTDDAYKALLEGAPVEVVYPDQADGAPGALLIPNTVALVAGGPHPEAAERLLRWIVSPENERRLAEGSSAQIPLQPGVPTPVHVRSFSEGGLTAMEVDWRAVGENRSRWLGFLKDVFVPAP